MRRRSFLVLLPASILSTYGLLYAGQGRAAPPAPAPVRAFLPLVMVAAPLHPAPSPVLPDLDDVSTTGGSA